MNVVFENSSIFAVEDESEAFSKSDLFLQALNAQANENEGTSQDDETDDDQTDTNSDDETPEDEGPFPVEPDGGPGDGAGPPPTDGPIPVEPDGGTGDGAGPPPGDGPFPVEPDGGIGDGAGPIPISEGPFPVEPDGGIGDGAGPLPINVSESNMDTPSRGLVIADDDYDETFYFVEDDHGGAIIGFDLTGDTLDLSQTATDFVNLDDLKAASSELTNAITGEVFGVTIDLGNGQVGYLAGLTLNDLDTADIIF